MLRPIRWVMSAFILTGLVLGCTESPRNAFPASTESQVQIACSDMLPVTVAAEEWDQLSASTVRSWNDDVFEESSEVEVYDDVVGSELPSAAWNSGNFEYSAIFNTGFPLKILAVYDGKDRVSLDRWLECAGVPDAFIAQRVQQHEIVTVFYLFYPSKGYIVELRVDDDAERITGDDASLFSVRMLRPSERPIDLVTPPNAQKSTITNYMQYARPWAGIGDGIVVASELER